MDLKQGGDVSIETSAYDGEGNRNEPLPSISPFPHPVTTTQVNTDPQDAIWRQVPKEEFPHHTAHTTLQVASCLWSRPRVLSASCAKSTEGTESYPLSVLDEDK